MIAEYVYTWPQTGKQEVRHRCSVDSPMDCELKRQLSHLQGSHADCCYSRREVKTTDGPLEGESNNKKKPLN